MSAGTARFWFWVHVVTAVCMLLAAGRSVGWLSLIQLLVGAINIRFAVRVSLLYHRLRRARGPTKQ